MSLAEYIKKNKTRVDIVYGKLNDIEFLYLKNGINLELWQRDFLPNLENIDLNNLSPGLVSTINIRNDNSYDRLLGQGNVLLLKDKKEYSIFLSFISKRNPQDSLIDPSNLVGSRDGFNELLADNRNLVRKRIKSSDLVFIEYQIGKLTKTELNLVYIDKLANYSALNIIKKILNNNFDKNITSIIDLNKIFTPKQKLVPIYEITGNPETVANALLNGRIILMIDNSPNCLILPTSLFELTENINETNSPTYSTIFNRIFILIFMFISLFSLGLFIVLSCHHPEALTTIFIANLQLTERGTTFPLFLEIIIVLILFEFYRQLTSRSPLSFVQNIIIIFGGIFIGQNAIESSLIGSISILIASLSFVSSFAVTNNPFLITSFSIFRFLILIMSYILGIIGFIISSIIVIDYLINLETFNKPYLSPFIPFDKQKIKKWFKPAKE